MSTLYQPHLIAKHVKGEKVLISCELLLSVQVQP